MCTLIVLDRVVPRTPLVVASNRDEYLARPAAPPTRIEPREEGMPAFVAPQDLEAGGTWMGVNSHGLFVGLTNRPTEKRRADRRSRGLLVLDALQHDSAARLAREMEPGLEGTYNPFNVLYADGRETFVTSLGEGGSVTRALDPGAHILCNREVNDTTSPKGAGLRRRLSRLDLGAPLEGLLGQLRALLQSHEPADHPLDAVCVHTPGYGTRSSSLMALGADRWRYWHADGAPCQTKYRNHTTLLDSLRQPSPWGIES